MSRFYALAQDGAERYLRAHANRASVSLKALAAAVDGECQQAGMLGALFPKTAAYAAVLPPAARARLITDRRVQSLRGDSDEFYVVVNPFHPGATANTEPVRG